MLHSLQISNFQSHKKSTLEFSTGVNVIIGASDSGKSSILRGIKWLARNRPSGEAFRSIWGGDTKVSLVLDGKQKIERFKSNKDNKYLMDGKSYSSFKQDVPEDIKKLLNISATNSQGQFDAPFLLSQSSGEVARYLNKVVQLDKIDTANYNINSTIRKERQDLNYEKERERELEEKLKDYVWLDEAEGRLVALEQFEVELFKKKSDREELIQLRNDIVEVEVNIKEIDEVVQHEGEVDDLIELSEKIEKKKIEIEELKDLANEIRMTRNAIEDIGGGIKVTQKEFNKIMPKICPLCGNPTHPDIEACDYGT